MAQQYDGGQSVDLDLDKDFFDAVGRFSRSKWYRKWWGDLDAELGLDSLEYGADPELVAAMNQGIPIANPAQPVSQTLQEAKDKIKGEGLSAFTKGLQRGLGGFLKSDKPSNQHHNLNQLNPQEQCWTGRAKLGYSRFDWRD